MTARAAASIPGQCPVMGRSASEIASIDSGRAIPTKPLDRHIDLGA
jgi:hypothetical protein